MSSTVATPQTATTRDATRATTRVTASTAKGADRTVQSTGQGTGQGTRQDTGQGQPVTLDWRLLLSCVASPWSSAFQLAAHAQTYAQAHAQSQGHVDTAAKVSDALARLEAGGLLQRVTQALPHLPHSLYAPTDDGVTVVAERWQCDRGVVAWRARLSERRFWWLRAALPIAQEVNGLCARLAHARPEWRVTWETAIVRTYHKHTLMLHGRLALWTPAAPPNAASPANVSPYYLLVDHGTQPPLWHWRMLRYLAIGSKRYAKDALLTFPPLLIVTTAPFRAIALMQLAHRLNFVAPIAATWDRPTLLGVGAHAAEWATLVRSDTANATGGAARVVLSPAAPFAAGLLRQAEPKHAPHVLTAPTTSGQRRRAVPVPALTRLPEWGKALQAVEALDPEAMRVLAFVCRHPVCSTELVDAYSGRHDTGAIIARLKQSGLVAEAALDLPFTADTLAHMLDGHAGEGAARRAGRAPIGGAGVPGRNNGRGHGVRMADLLNRLAKSRQSTSTQSAPTLKQHSGKDLAGDAGQRLLSALQAGIRPTPAKSPSPAKSPGPGADRAGTSESASPRQTERDGRDGRDGRDVWVMRLPGFLQATSEAIVLRALREGLGSEEALRRAAACARDRLRRPHHTIAVDHFFVRLGRDAHQLAQATRPATNAAPYYAIGDYIDEPMARVAFGDRLSARRFIWQPDGYGVIRCGDQVTRFWLEIDGTQHTRARLDVGAWRDKAETLCAYRASDAWARAHEIFPIWLIVTADLNAIPAIHAALHEAAATFGIDVPATFVAGAGAIRQRGPLSKVWIALHTNLTPSVLLGREHTWTFAFEGVQQPGIVDTPQRLDLLGVVSRGDALGLIDAIPEPAKTPTKAPTKASVNAPANAPAKVPAKAQASVPGLGSVTKPSSVAPPRRGVRSVSSARSDSKTG